MFSLDYAMIFAYVPRMGSSCSVRQDSGSFRISVWALGSIDQVPEKAGDTAGAAYRERFRQSRLRRI
jgi:hypothetical protein